MSSEMREWKFGDRVEWQDSPGNWHEAVIIGQREGHDCTEYEAILADGDRVAWYAFGRFRALLARTEAGADGAVAFRIALGDCIWQDRVFHAPSHDLAVERGTPIEYAYTHPQDASGDAVTEADIVALVAGPYKYHHKMDEQAEREAKAFDRCRELTIQKVQTFFAMRAAMQAKEAK